MESENSLYIQEQDFIQIKEEFPATHYFLYKNKQYPINFDYFKYSSNYFSDNQKELEKNPILRLVDKRLEESLNFTDESINNFIGYIEHKKVPLTNENSTTFHYLAKKYEIKSLIEITEQYISNHHQELAIQMILVYQHQSDFETSIYEDVISNNLMDYVNNEQLLSVKITILYRIIKKYYENKNSFNSQIFEFLFKCLQKFGREASILFSFVDFSKEKSEYLNRLLTNYADVFDFHFINSSHLKSIYNFQNDLFQNEKNNQIKIEKVFNSIFNEIKEMKIEINKIKDNRLIEFEEQKKKENEDAFQIKNEIELIKKELNFLKQKNLQKEDEQKKSNNEINLFKDETKKLLISQSEKLINENLLIKQEFQKYQKDEDKEKNNIQKKLNELKKNIGRIECSSFFESEIDLDIFNEIDGESQFNIINEIKSTKNNENVLKISNFLSFLSNEYRKSDKQNKNMKYIFIPPKSKQENNKKSKNNLKIGISSNMTEILFQNQSFNSKEFKNHINDFSEFFIEICYPSTNYANIYQNALNLKRIHQDKLKIGIFIKEMETTDQNFYKNNIINYVRFDSSVKNISVENENKGSFFGCSSLTQVSIPSSVICIGNYSFCGCFSLTHVSIPFSVISIGDYAFYGCSSLVQISISSSVKSIGNNAFRKCLSLKQISIPNSVISIGEFAFKDCPSLKQISIPSSVTSIGINTFD